MPLIYDSSYEQRIFDVSTLYKSLPVLFGYSEQLYLLLIWFLFDQLQMSQQLFFLPTGIHLLPPIGHSHLPDLCLPLRYLLIIDVVPQLQDRLSKSYSRNMQSVSIGDLLFEWKLPKLSVLMFHLLLTDLLYRLHDGILLAE